MEFEDILLYSMGVLMSILGFLLKSIYSDVRECKKEFEELKRKTEIQDHKQGSAIHVENLKFKQITENILEIKQDIKELKEELGYIIRKRDSRGRYIKRPNRDE